MNTPEKSNNSQQQHDKQPHNEPPHHFAMHNPYISQPPLNPQHQQSNFEPLQYLPHPQYLQGTQPLQYLPYSQYQQDQKRTIIIVISTSAAALLVITAIIATILLKHNPSSQDTMAIPISSSTTASITSTEIFPPTVNSEFNFQSFDPCKFTSNDLHNSGLPPMPNQKVRKPSPANPPSNPDTIISGCSYSSDDNRWSLVIQKEIYRGSPDDYTWMHPTGSFSNRYVHVVNSKTVIKEHLAYLQEQKYIANHYSFHPGDSLCIISVSPGVSYFLADANGKYSTETSRLCTLLIKFLNTKIY